MLSAGGDRNIAHPSQPDNAKRTSVKILMTRREFATATGAAVLAPPAFAQTLTRVIPSSGELLPAVGLGSANELFILIDKSPVDKLEEKCRKLGVCLSILGPVLHEYQAYFNTPGKATRDKAAAIVQVLIANGGRLIDTASSYGEAESVLGDVIAAADLRDKLFIATKLETPDAEELRRSLGRLRTEKLDLLQLHNLRDPHQSLAPFREWKAHGVCRYIGITSTSHDDFSAIGAVLEHERPDFVQIAYSLDDREAEKRILPLAAEVKAGVLTALPFGHGRLFSAVRGKSIPNWARVFADSWARFFLKYLLGDPRVTAIIPGTTDPRHMRDNLDAMSGPLPDPEERQKMAMFIETL